MPEEDLFVCGCLWVNKFKITLPVVGLERVAQRDSVERTNECGKGKGPNKHT